VTRSFTLGLLALALTGCGTTANIHLPKELGGRNQLEVYGGVSNSVAMARTCADRDGVGPKFLAALVALDVPLSAIGDTLTLPITMTVAAWRLYESSREEAKPPPADDKPAGGHLVPERIHGGII
jgi:uncharacterized protein YceK